MTPADLERVRGVLREHYPADPIWYRISDGSIRGLCRCDWTSELVENVTQGLALVITHVAAEIVAVLAAQDEAGGTGQ